MELDAPATDLESRPPRRVAVPTSFPMQSDTPSINSLDDDEDDLGYHSAGSDMSISDTASDAGSHAESDNKSDAESDIKSDETRDTDNGDEDMGVAIKARPNDNLIDEVASRNAPEYSPTLMQRIRSRLRDYCNCGGVRKFSVTCTEAQAEHVWLAINSSSASALVDPNVIRPGDTHLISVPSCSALVHAHGGNWPDASITMAPKFKLTRYPIETLPTHGDDTGITVDPWYVGLHLGDGDQSWPKVGTVDEEIRVKMQAIIDRVNLGKPAHKAPMPSRPQLNNGPTTGPIVGTQEAL